ncbi:hypothetical protein Leryth_013680 [Lithospermum erythrorhizon]|uniref:DNA-directed DNA polymerase n=1 Tax=Lithospermum erythrorhizon TaxID=34254 RepID=A0AAV3Q8V7_LITER|nr:hypothetical protein Leryth_013680 [Lithospermum erythrorhizon]
MSTSSSKSDMKGFYKQKKSGGITKSKGNSTPKHSATCGSEAAQPPALVTSRGTPDLKDNYDDNEEMLRQFDMNMAYGPCLGMSRLDRWERAVALGLNPPETIEHLLKLSDVRLGCLWDGRV